MKTCNTYVNCAFKATMSASVGFECRYAGYCDYQAPRDSRQQSNKEEVN